jgi:hypothetical protein
VLKLVIGYDPEPVSYLHPVLTASFFKIRFNFFTQSPLSCKLLDSERSHHMNSVCSRPIIYVYHKVLTISHSSSDIFLYRYIVFRHL